MKTDVESKLRTAGIEVVDRDKSDAELGVNVTTTTQESTGRLSFGMNLNLMQPILLCSNPKAECMAVTWMTGCVAMGRRTKISYVRERLNELVGIFLNDYLAVNPKK